MAPLRTIRFTSLQQMYLPISRSRSMLCRRCSNRPALNRNRVFAFDVQVECLMKFVTLISALLAALFIVISFAPKKTLALQQTPQTTPTQTSGQGQANPPEAQGENRGRGNAGARPTPPPPPPAVMPPPVMPIVSMTPPN